MYILLCAWGFSYHQQKVTQIRFRFPIKQYSSIFLKRGLLKQVAYSFLSIWKKEVKCCIRVVPRYNFHKLHINWNVLKYSIPLINLNINIKYWRFCDCFYKDKCGSGVKALPIVLRCSSVCVMIQWCQMVHTIFIKRKLQSGMSLGNAPMEFHKAIA